MRHGWAAVLAGMLILLAAAPAAFAAHDRDNIPPGLDQTLANPNFVIHYDADTYTQAKAQALLDDLQESRSKLVAGGVGSPNAGPERTPPDDGDGKTDVYIGAPTDRPDFTGGAVYPDNGHFSSYMFMTPGLSRSGTRFRSAHEYMHVIQRAYYGWGHSLLTESLANWASEWALPDVDPQDAFFGKPFLPLDCSYGTWPPGGGSAPTCGNGYWQWSFFWRLSQRFGVAIIDRLLDEVAADCPFDCTTTQDRAILRTSSPRSPARHARVALRGVRARRLGARPLVDRAAAADDGDAVDPQLVGRAARDHPHRRDRRHRDPRPDHRPPRDALREAPQRRRLPADRAGRRDPDHAHAAGRPEHGVHAAAAASRTGAGRTARRSAATGGTW